MCDPPRFACRTCFPSPTPTPTLPREQRSKGRVQDLLVSRKGSVRDKLRLLGVYCLATRPSVAELAELEEILKKSAASSGVEGAEQEAERGLGAITYLRKQVRVVGRFGRSVQKCVRSSGGLVTSTTGFIENLRYAR